MGAMVSDGQRDRAVRMVETAQAEGAQCRHRRAPSEPTGRLPGTDRAGRRHAPTWRSRRRRSSARSCRSCPFRDEAEAIEIANGTDYGLVAGVFTADLDRATRAASQLRRAGLRQRMVCRRCRDALWRLLAKSGYGREKGREALWNYVQTKNVAIKRRIRAPVRTKQAEQGRNSDMSIKPPLTELPIRTAENGFYRGFTKDVTITAKILVGALILWAVAFPEQAGSVLGAMNAFILASFNFWYVYVMAFFITLCLGLALWPRAGRMKLNADLRHG
jgi:hypothetical protein